VLLQQIHGCARQTAASRARSTTNSFHCCARGSPPPFLFCSSISTSMVSSGWFPKFAMVPGRVMQNADLIVLCLKRHGAEGHAASKRPVRRSFYEFLSSSSTPFLCQVQNSVIKASATAVHTGFCRGDRQAVSPSIQPHTARSQLRCVGIAVLKNVMQP